VNVSPIADDANPSIGDRCQSSYRTRRKPADGSTHWSSRKLAAELGGATSHMTVARIWANHGIEPHRLEGYLSFNGEIHRIFCASPSYPARHDVPRHSLRTGG